jgi:hypothetical protein
MGNTETTASIVALWGDKERENNLSDPRIDVLEIRTNKRSEIHSIGICRPLKGRAEAKLTIRHTKEKNILHEETFEIRSNYLEERCIFQFKKRIPLQLGAVYEIKVTYEGAPCYTYSESKLRIREEDHEIELRRQLDDNRNSNNYRALNLITDIGCTVSEKGRECC